MNLGINYLNCLRIFLFLGVLLVFLKVSPQPAHAYVTVTLEGRVLVSDPWSSVGVSGTAPLNDVDLRASVTGAAGFLIQYRFDCTNNGTYEHDFTTSDTPYAVADLCDYPTAGSYTARVRVDVLALAEFAEDTLPITVSSGPTPTPTPTPGGPTPTPTPTPGGPTPTPTPTPGACSSNTVSGIVFTETASAPNCTPDSSAGLFDGARIRLYDTIGNPQGEDPSSGPPAGSYSINPSICATDLSMTISNIPGYRLKSVRHPSAYPSFSSIPVTGFTYSGPIDTNSPQKVDLCITNFIPWWQTTTGDVRMGNLINRVPSTKFASDDTSNPSVFYSSSFATEFGLGSASTKGWKVDDEYSYQDDSKNRNGSMSYSFYMSRIAQQSVVTENIPGCAASGDCTTSITIPAATFKAYHLDNGNLILNSYSQPAETRVLVLVNGNVSINGNVTVPTGSLLIIASKRNIIIDESIGTLTYSSTAPQIQGVLTAEGDIEVEAATSCASAKRLNVAGALIANSVKPFQVGGAGSLVNNRSLCSEDQNYPSLYVSSRYDFVTVLTDFYKTSFTRWREVAP